ncbi:MAG: biotin--[acetyl-CoA-carboxylase] ligase [Chloroflexi bacterium]|nr:biotin--[acetyl-CoA-carboxylase] ligase [Chloroflexota bacterium]
MHEKADAPLDPTALSRALAGSLFGGAIEHHRLIDSTNWHAAELAAAGAPEGLVVLAEEQSAGRGRLGRRWLAPAGSALLCSLVLRPRLDPRSLHRLTMIATLSAAEAIGELHTLPVEIKWPNDLLLHGRKVGGMLCEAALQGHTLRHVVLGLGINVNLAPSTLGEVLIPAASLSDALGHPVPRAALLVALLRRFEQYYVKINAGWLPVDAWRARLATLGQNVEVGTPEGLVTGVAEDVDGDGALLVRTPSGKLVTILAGDVTLRGRS